MKIWRTSLIILGFFIGLNALGGSIAMLIDTSGELMGMEELLAYIPFESFLIPAVILLVCIALTHFILAIATIKKLQFTALFGKICGMVLMIWIIVEVCYINFNVLSVVFLVLGLVEIICAFMLKRTVKKQNRIIAGGILR